MPEKWSHDELNAAVEAYMTMLQFDLDHIPYSKKDHYRELADRFGRTAKSFEYRMQNISYVRSRLGKPWLTGLRPAKNVGENVAAIIESMLSRFEEPTPLPPATPAPARPTIPTGSICPPKRIEETTVFERNTEVAAWVLNQANGICECCKKPAPFIDADGNPFLESHHVRRLADGGSDTVHNAVAICPNCHREAHLGQYKEQLMEALYQSVPRLIRE